MSRLNIVILIFVFGLFTGEIHSAYNYSLHEDLRTFIFVTNPYNRFIRPDETVIVKIDMLLYSLSRLDIKEEVMEVSIFVNLYWYDPRFNWSTNALYSSIPSLRTHVEYAWVPAVGIANSASDLSDLTHEKKQVLAYSNGLTYVSVGKIETTSCSTDVTYYPFDTQTCEIRFIGLNYIKEEVELRFSETPLLMSFFMANGEWEYIRYSTSYDDIVVAVGQTVRTIIISLTFRRRPLFQFINSLLPVTLLSFVTCLIFKLPADSGEKVGFCLTVLLAFAVYLTIISDHVPTTSISTPYLSIYLIIILALGVASVMITIFVLRCHHCSATKPIPKWLEKLTKRFLIPIACRDQRACCRCCCYPEHRKVEARENDENENASKKLNHKNNELSWQEIGMIIDLFSFRISLFICIFMAIFTYITMAIGYIKA